MENVCQITNLLKVSVKYNVRTVLLYTDSTQNITKFLY